MLGVEVELTDPPALKGNEELLTLEGVAGGKEVSIREFSFARSALLPTRRTVRFGEARARASLMKVGRPVKVLCDVRS
jgi:hypothetical protein